MGLDVTAYSKAKHIETMGRSEDWENKYWLPNTDTKTDFIHPSTVGSFNGRSGDLIAGGVYEFAQEYGFRAGSYSGYNWWRNELALMSNGVEAKEFWKHETDPEWQQKPFFYLIDFSDCEGYIGTEYCAKLAADFAEYQDRADQYTPKDYDGDWFREAYKRWRHACQLAADGGYLDFH